MIGLAFEVVEGTGGVQFLLIRNETGVFVERSDDHLPLLVEILADFVDKPEENNN